MIEFELEDPSRIIGLDWGMTIRNGVKSYAEPYAAEEARRILERTPDTTGSLAADEMYDSNADPTADLIAHFWTGNQHQLAAYGRVYSIYVEGPPTPIGTDPLNVGGINGIWATPLWAQGYSGANMYGDVANDEDVGILADYGFQGVQAGIDEIVAGGGGFRL